MSAPHVRRIVTLEHLEDSEQSRSCEPGERDSSFPHQHLPAGPGSARLPVVPKEKNETHREAIILPCASKQYFTNALRASGAYPLLWTTGLMAPEHTRLRVRSMAGSQVRAASRFVSALPPPTISIRNAECGEHADCSPRAGSNTIVPTADIEKP